MLHKPGNTGCAQARRPYDESVDGAIETLQHDPYNVGNPCHFLGFMIRIATVAVVLSEKGAR